MPTLQSQQDLWMHDWPSRELQTLKYKDIKKGETTKGNKKRNTNEKEWPSSGYSRDSDRT